MAPHSIKDVHIANETPKDRIILQDNFINLFQLFSSITLFLRVGFIGIENKPATKSFQSFTNL